MDHRSELVGVIRGVRNRLRQRLALRGALVAVAAAALVTLGPAYLRHGLSALLIISRSAEASSPYRIQVTPGNAKVPKGADQVIRASLVGFNAKDAVVMMRTASGAPFERVPLLASADDGSFE